MARTLQFKKLANIPKSVRTTTGMHPETLAIVKQLKASKAKVLSCECTTPQHAKRRLDAVKRARARGSVRFKEAHRRGKTLYFRLR